MKQEKDAQLGSLWLDCALVMPGDVLLISSAGSKAAVIKWATKGPYSHIALVLNSATLLESDGDGVGHSILLRDRVEEPTASHGSRILYRLSSRDTAALVLRKPGFAAHLEKEKIDLLEVTRPFLWREYAELAALAKTLEDRPVLRRLAPSVLRWVEAARKSKPERPGLFCSELVASVFELILGEPLLKECTAKELSPNDFLELGFEVVENAITTPDESAEERPDLAEVLNFSLRLAFSRDLLPDLVAFQNLVESLKEEADQYDAEHPEKVDPDEEAEHPEDSAS